VSSVRAIVTTAKRIWRRCCAHMSKFQNLQWGGASISLNSGRYLEFLGIQGPQNPLRSPN